MKRVVIAGGAGFIGINTASYYLKKGYKVTIFDSLARKGCAENIKWLQKRSQTDRLTLLEGDVRSPSQSLQQAVEQADALFHFASQVAVTTSVADPRHDFEVNAQGTFNMLELIRLSKGKQPVFFYSSTNKVYGGLEDVVIAEHKDSYLFKDYPDGISEDRCLDFHSPYGCSKGAADQYVKDYARIYDLKTVVFRQSCIYGYRQFGVEDQGWVAWFVIAAVLGKPITIYGDGKQVRDVLFIDDLVSAFDMAWKNIDNLQKNPVYNIGGGKENAISLIQLIHYLQDKVGLQLHIRYGDWRPGDQLVYISDIAKASHEFGWQPKFHWTTGIQRLVEWVTANKPLFQDVMA